MKPFFSPSATVLFLGDSTTDCGRDRADPADLSAGYPGKAANIYRALFPEQKVTFYNRGVDGNRMGDLLARYEVDVRGLQPDFVSILIGVNDTWRRYDAQSPISAEDFSAQYERLLRRLREDRPGITVMVMEPFLLPLSPERELWREDLDPKLRKIRALAARYADYYLPLDGLMTAQAVRTGDPAALAADGIHPTDAGHRLIAAAYLHALGVL